MQWARESVAKQFKNFKARRFEIQKIKNEKRIEKLETKKRKEPKLLLTKEGLCASISKYGELWMTEVDQKLSELPPDKTRGPKLKFAF